MACLRRLSCDLGVLFLVISGACSQTSSRPHIVFIMTDDWGWGDTSDRNPAMYTPNIDSLTREGVNMTSSYMQQVCTPSRAAFLTGMYPIHLGLQYSVFNALKNNSLPLNFKVLPEHLKEMNYTNHYVGKWHLGFCHPLMTPTGRGFDTFYGKYNGVGDFFNHTSKWDGYDMHYDNGTNLDDSYHIAEDARGVYSTHLFSDRAVQILQQHSLSEPLFLFLSYQAVHGPIQVPQHYVDTYCSNVTADELRKIHCGMAAAVDEGIGNITSALKSLGYWDNLILVFMSDNGGPNSQGSSNYPFRGAKITLWEGGTRVVTTMVSQKYLPNSPYTWDGLMHAIDWYPTLMKAAGYTGTISGIDGMDLWEDIVNNRASSRTEMLYNIDPVKEAAAIRVGHYKLHNGTNSPSGWEYPPPGAEPISGERKQDVMLFNLKDDPSETTHVDNQTLIDELMAKLQQYRDTMQPLMYAEKISAGNPRKHNGNWVTGWCDA